MTDINTDSLKANGSSASYMGALTAVTVLFFLWGFLTELNDVLVPHLKSIFDLNYFQAMLIQFAFFSAYLLLSIPWAKVIDWIGYKRTMVAGLFTSGLGAFLFLPAAKVPSYPLFLAALLVLAAGITALQVAANAYVAVLGPPKTSSSRLNFAQAVNSLGHTTAPWIGGLFILSAAPVAIETVRRMSAEAQQAYRLHEAASVKLPYVFIGVVLIGLGIALAKFRLPAISEAERHGQAGITPGLWRHRNLVLGVIGIFLYVGAEVSIGSFLINYLIQPEIGNLSAKVAARFVSLYWGSAMVGRFAGSAILQKVRTEVVLCFAALSACGLVCTSVLTLGQVAMWSIILVGFFNSVMFPSIFTLGIAKLGPLTSDGSGLLIMAIVGGAVIPVSQGALADRIGIHHAFLLSAFCYLYVAYYAIRGSKPIIME